MDTLNIPVDSIDSMIEDARAELAKESYMKAFPEMKSWNEGYIAALELLKKVF